MLLTILGAGTAIPLPGHSPAGYLVRVGDTPLLFDAGPGTIARLAAAGVAYHELEHVFITHFHSDHTLDLATLFQCRASTPGSKPTQTLRLIGPRGLQGFVACLLDIYPGLTPVEYAVDISEIGEERWEFPAWTTETARTGHTPNSLAFRLEAEGRVLVYSGDAVETESLVRLARAADLFVCECSLPGGWTPGNHLTADAVGRIAQAARVRRLVLTHLYPSAWEANVAAQVREIYDGEVIAGLDAMSFSV